MKFVKPKTLIVLTALLFWSLQGFCVGEAGTYFNIYVAPNNEILGRDVAVIVTALEDQTNFKIYDTTEDGDSDDNATGILKAGQSYILFLRENGVNDDAPHSGEAASKQDGDHFIITGNKLLLVSSACISEFQHSWLPATNKTSKGKKFFIYSNQVNTSPNDINIMAFEDGTVVNVRKISQTATLHSGYTNVSLTHDSLVFQKTLSRGKDLIYYYTDGRDALKPGESYMITSNKEVSVQYGALYTNEHDAGGYVPSENGSSSGVTFYFTVPFQDSAQQEVRVISWDNSNAVVLECFVNGNWITVKNFGTLNKNQTAEWVGKTNMQTYSTVFRVRGSANKKVSVVEDNWVETGKMLTSDLAMMVSPDNGSSAGQNFLAYMPIPSKESNVLSALTNSYLPQQATHAYVFGNKSRTTHVTVKDAYSNGGTINRTYTIAPGGYADVVLDSLQWLSIYNGTGTMAGGAQRPYLSIKANNDVAVMVSNFNDNCMLHYGSSMAHGFEIEDGCDASEYDGHSGDIIHIISHILHRNMIIQNCSIRQIVDDGLFVSGARFRDSTTNTFINGAISFDSTLNKTLITFSALGNLDTTHVYMIETDATPTCFYHNGNAIEENTVLSAETFMNGTIDTSEEIAENTVGIAYHILDSPAPFTISNTEVTPGEQIVSTATNSAATYLWDLGNGQTSDSASAHFSYASTGTYTISLTTVNQWGCTASSSQVITVSEQLNAVNNLSNENIRIWSSGNQVYVDFLGTENVDAEITFYNTLGQRIDEIKEYTARIYTHSLVMNTSEYVIVSVRNNGKLYNKKVFIGS